MNKLKVVTSLIALSTAFAAAQAQEQASVLEKSLVESGFVAVSDGLYADPAATGRSLVATNRAGQLTLIEQVQADHTRFLQIAQKDGVSQGEQHALDGLLSTIQSLRQTLSVNQAKASQSNYGACLTPNGATLYASATSNNGTSASASAVNALDFGPITPTSNYAEASTELSTNTGYGIGATAANASASHGQSCFAYGYGSVTCPGESSPGVSAYASSLSTRARCLY